VPDPDRNEPSWQIRITGPIVPWVEFDATALRDCHEAFDPIDL
jgi:hypothetical protein